MDSEIILVESPIPRTRLAEIAAGRFGDMVKAVVDVSRGNMAIGGELHSDEEAFLLERGARQQDLWGINLYPGPGAPELVEFDSMINLRPSQRNRSRSVDDPAVREKILALVQKLVG